MAPSLIAGGNRNTRRKPPEVPSDEQMMQCKNITYRYTKNRLKFGKHELRSDSPSPITPFM
jgi:hypothetical protein